jgi:pyrroline-5-carboxylate reductase
MNVGIIGCGNMGGALLSAISAQSVHPIVAYDVNREKVEVCVPGTYRDLDVLLKESDVVIIAIKPQVFPLFAEQVGISLKDKLVVSIMAGISIEHIRKLLGVTRIVRCMPNMPVFVQSGVLGWFAENTSPRENEVLDELFSLAGLSMRLPDEVLVDRCTLISGCGPAYVALFADMMQTEAVRLGFDEHVARQIVMGTFEGTLRLLDSDVSFEDLRKQVASKGGVTEAVLEHLAQHDFPSVFENGIDAGMSRMKELNGK